MQYFAEYNPWGGGEKSCPTYRAAGHDEKAPDGVKHGVLRQRNKPGPDLVQIPIRENGKQIQYNMRTTGRVRSCLGRYEDSAKMIVKPNNFLRTKEDE